MEYEGDSDTHCNWCTWNDTQRLGKKTARGVKSMKRRNHSNYSIVKIGENTEKNPADLQRFAINHTPVKDQKII